MTSPDIRGGIAAVTAVTVGLALGGCGGASGQAESKAIPTPNYPQKLVPFPTQPEALSLVERAPIGSDIYIDGGIIEHQVSLRRTTTLAGYVAVCLSQDTLSYTSIWQQEEPWGINTTMSYQTIYRNLSGLCKGNERIDPAKWHHYGAGLQKSHSAGPQRVQA
jgi:hypothetical protein